MLDLTLLRILKHKVHYDRIVPNLPKKALDEKTMTVLRDFGSYLKDTGHPVVKMGAFKTFFFNFKHPNLPAEVAQYYAKLLDKAEKDVDDATLRVMANQLIELGFATDVGNLASNYHRGDDVDIIHTVGLKHETAKASIMTGNAKELFVVDDIQGMLEADKNMEGLRFSIPCLHDGLRPLRNGDFIIVAARPDTGKTTFIVSELLGMTESLDDDDVVLWFNNEGEGNRIIKRLYQSFLNCTVEELITKMDAGTLLEEFSATNGPKVRVIDCHNWDTLMVEQVIADVLPKLVIFDMIDNLEFKGEMKVGENARTDQVLESQYQWGRKIGVKYSHPTMATSQVSAEVEQSADLQCWPPMHALKDSKTGKQGAADLIIMIGRSSDPMCANDRFIGTPKNKLARGGVTDIRQQVTIDVERARYG